MGQNHIVDPLFFYDVIEEFAFDYDWYANCGVSIDDMGRQVSSYDKRTIHGSLQTQGMSLSQNLSKVNTQSMSYKFYCMSVYRIQIGDYIFYKDRWLYVTDIRDYDEAGVRIAALTMVNLDNHKDFKEYLKYLGGSITV